MGPKNTSSVERLLVETQESVTRLLRANRVLKAQNAKLRAELARVSKGWEQIKALARQAPRARRR
jgi:hypothetical protein